MVDFLWRRSSHECHWPSCSPRCNFVHRVQQEFPRSTDRRLLEKKHWTLSKKCIPKEDPATNGLFRANDSGWFGYIEKPPASEFHRDHSIPRGPSPNWWVKVPILLAVIRGFIGTSVKTRVFEALQRKSTGKSMDFPAVKSGHQNGQGTRCLCSSFCFGFILNTSGNPVPWRFSLGKASK